MEPRLVEMTEENKVLNAPVHLAVIAATVESQAEEIKSIWVTARDDGMVMMSKKDSRMETKRSTSKTTDMRIENLDVVYGNRVLLQGADLTLDFGRRYGLIGQNGLVKTTSLRMISSKQLRILSHVILHLEQEVAEDETSAPESVLESDY